MRKLLFVLLAVSLIACSDDDKDSPIDVAKAKAEEYVSLVRQVDVSLSKLTFEGIYERTITTSDEYFNHLTDAAGLKNPPKNPIADLEVTDRQLSVATRFLTSTIGLGNWGSTSSGDVVYEVYYKYTPKTSSSWRFVVAVSKDMQVVNKCASSTYYTVRECLQKDFDFFTNSNSSVE